MTESAAQRTNLRPMASPDRLRSTVASFLAKPAPIDWLLAATFTLAGELEVVLRLPGVANEWELDAAGALALLGLAWWRRQPLVPSILLAGSAVGSVAAGARTPMVVPQLAFFVATYALGAYARNLELGLGAALPALAGLAIDVLLPHPPVNVLSGLVWYLVFVTAAPILIGRLVRSRSQLLERLKQQRTALLAAGEAGAREAVIAERQSISRQLRQVVASCVESVLADVAVVEADRGAKGLTSLVRIESVARWALAEMRRLLEGLRLPDAETLPGPDPPPIPKPLDDAEPNHAFATARAVQKALGSAPWPVALAVLTLAWFEAGVLPMVPVHTSRLLVGVCLIGVAAPIAWSRTRPLASAALSLLALALISRLLVPIPSSGASAVLAIYLPVAVEVFGAGRQA